MVKSCSFPERRASENRASPRHCRSGSAGSLTLGCAISVRRTMPTARSIRSLPSSKGLPASPARTRREPSSTSSRRCCHKPARASPYAAALIADLLAVPNDGRCPPLPSDPRRQREETFAILVRQFEGLARAQQVLVVFEDVHWCNSTSLELLERHPGAGAALAGSGRDNVPPGVPTALDRRSPCDASDAGPARPA